MSELLILLSVRHLWSSSSSARFIFKNSRESVNVATDKRLFNDLQGNLCLTPPPPCPKVKNIKQFNQHLHGWIVEIYFFVHYKHMAWICSHYRCWEKGKANIYITLMFYSKNTVQFVYTVPLLQFLWLVMKPL